MGYQPVIVNRLFLGYFEQKRPISRKIVWIDFMVHE